MDETLYGLLVRSAQRHPDRPAIQFGGEVVRYGEMRERVDRLAGLLTERGAAPGARVAFCFTKSIDALVTLFAVNRTGATYVPLDPAWPDARKQPICREADIRAWTGTDPPPDTTPFETVLASNPTGDSLSLGAAADHPPARGEARPCKDDLANILYTSGSTGRPKGVQITTRSLLHFSQWALETFGLGPDDRLANHAPYNFDLSTLDIFAAVRAGATMIPVPESLKMFPYQMARFIAAQRITVWYSVPSALMMMRLRGKLDDHDLRALRHVLFAGEVMPKPAMQAMAALLPGRSFANLYGPTETNVCTWHPVSTDDLACDEPVPIGRPISATRVWLVDERLKPTTGDSGELLVAGPTLTSGYFADAQLTARRLVPAPDGDGLAYRTGDRVRRRSDGVLMFEGRIDRMVKCRGHRIEPGEIETVLAGHPDVREAAIVALPDPVFGNRLKACVAPSAVEDRRDALLAYCRERLPPYMVPDEWQFFASLPRTDRGKVDLQALSRA